MAQRGNGGVVRDQTVSDSIVSYSNGYPEKSTERSNYFFTFLCCHITYVRHTCSIKTKKPFCGSPLLDAAWLLKYIRPTEDNSHITLCCATSYLTCVTSYVQAFIYLGLGELYACLSSYLYTIILKEYLAYMVTM